MGKNFFTVARFDVLTAVLLKIQFFSDVSLGKWFTVFGRYYNALKHQELLIQPSSVISLMTIFLGVAMANYNEKFVTFVQEREMLYNTKKEYHNRNTVHNFRGK